MTGNNAVPTQLIVGSSRHAVTRYAETLARAVAAESGGPAVVRVQNARDAPNVVPGIRYLHVQFTDRLFGDTPEEAADLIEQLAQVTRLTVTLHDLPQHSDGERNLPRRAAAYARVVRSASAIACNSRHEALLLSEYSIPGLRAEIAVIPLPVEAAVESASVEMTRGPATPIAPDGGASEILVGTGTGTGTSSPTAPDAGDTGTSATHAETDALRTPCDQPVTTPEAAILGYFYPGKGHAEVIGAVAAGQLPLHVTALGTAAPGHDDDLATVVASAAGLGVTFTSTGYLDDHALALRLAAVAIPVAAHQHLSASASINTWIASGRRPLIPDGRYSREMAELRPGTVTVYAPHELALALEHAAEHPETTRLAPGTSVRPDVADVARLYLSWWAGLG